MSKRLGASLPRVILSMGRLGLDIRTAFAPSASGLPTLADRALTPSLPGGWAGASIAMGGHPVAWIDAASAEVAPPER
jgi:hypothetical protein